MLAEPVRISVYLSAEAEKIARQLAQKQGVTRNAVIRRALGLLQAFEDARDAGQFVGTTRVREDLEQVLVAPL
jgi:hypothetical protein